MSHNDSINVLSSLKAAIAKWASASTGNQNGSSQEDSTDVSLTALFEWNEVLRDYWHGGMPSLILNIARSLRG